MSADLRGPDPSRDRESNAGGSYESLLASYVDRLVDGEKLDPAQVHAAHPEHAERLLQDLESFVDPDARPSEEPLGTIGDYKLLRQIGRGGMGIVYEALESSLDRRVALKVLPAGVAADNKTFVRFCQEAKLAAKLHHPNIVPVFGMGIKEDTPALPLEAIGTEARAGVSEHGQADDLLAPAVEEPVVVLEHPARVESCRNEAQIRALLLFISQ